ncbi:hypothetical protein [uncultured Thomasclavelia sp.]|uniref:hypothetical protein n=1 Tax=uncultured Thomasclavelia sp. TaxID=3025759 RepID=UPI00262F86AA|nr:hypothetical protein [uncultured Thomasclavelia sp.]
MKEIITEYIEIKKIDDVKTVYNWLKQFSSEEETVYFVIEDEYCDNPKIRVMEQFEVENGKRFNFKYDGSRWFWHTDRESYYTTNQIASKIYDLILRVYK